MLVRINEIETIYREKESIELNPICNPSDIALYLRGAFESNYDQESFWVILLNSANCPFGRKMLTLGLANCVQINPLLVFRLAIREGASSIICSHNHPSGNLTPSTEDLQITRQLVSAGNILQIPLLDHLIVSPGAGWLSLKAQNPNLFQGGLI
jgi:DNA repair protein RadC